LNDVFVYWRKLHALGLLHSIKWRSFRYENLQSEIAEMFAHLKYYLGVAVLLCVGLLAYLQFSTSAPVFVVMPSAHPGQADGNNELAQLESVIRNVTNATVLQIGTVFSSCIEKTVRIGSVLLRDFGNKTKEIWLLFRMQPERVVETGLLNVRVFYNKNHLFSTHYDLCKKFLPSLTCPIPRQRQTYGLQYSLPRFSLPGNYVIEAWTVDQKGYTFACINANLTL
jgi:hypothetical protein